VIFGQGPWGHLRGRENKASGRYLCRRFQALNLGISPNFARFLHATGRAVLQQEGQRTWMSFGLDSEHVSKVLKNEQHVFRAVDLLGFGLKRGFFA